MTDISVEYMGLKLANPLIVASSGLTKSVKTIKECQDAGAGAVVMKSIFEEQIQMEIDHMTTGSEDTLWHPEAAEYINQYAQENAVEQYISTVREAKKEVSIPLIASVHCVTAGNWTDFAKRLEDAGADAIELNLFVLPSDPRSTGAQNEQVYFDVVEAVKKRVSIPLSLKVGFYFSSIASTLVKLGAANLDGLVLFNRFHSPDFDIENIKVVPANTMSHPGEYIRTLRWISILSQRIACDLSAATGIHDASSVIKQLLAGADSVQLCSVLYEKGLDVIAEIKDGLITWMQDHNFEDINSFKGKLSQSQSENPAQYERVQFMKTSVSV
jgi:dihydroorotate dehydrogenase (fumarate)